LAASRGTAKYRLEVEIIVNGIPTEGSRWEESTKRRNGYVDESK
jgi:hypothetical protein